MNAEVIRLFVPNSAQNYNHLVHCSDSKKTAVVDPFDSDFVFEYAQKHNLTIDQIWITHEHPDHTRGLAKLKMLTNAKVYAPVSCKGLFDADVWLNDQQEIPLGLCQITHLLTPGHTPGHGIFCQFDQWAICGDTLFNAGVGNVKSGDASILFNTISHLKTLFTDSMLIYTGHDYLTTNLKFSLSLQPNLTKARELLDKAELETPNTRTITNWATEKEINLFLHVDTESEFKILRAKRDQW